MICDYCQESIDHFALARVHVEIDNANFCSELCADQYLDMLDDEPDHIVCDECGRDVPNDKTCWYCENVSAMGGAALKAAVVENVRKQGLISDEQAEELMRNGVGGLGGEAIRR